MYDDKLYAAGVHSVFLVDWQFVCQTPLALRNGARVKYSDGAAPKARLQNMSLTWSEPGDQDKKVAALYYGYRVSNGRLESYHFVPPSSVRGALRSWTMRRLVRPDLLQPLTPPPAEDQAATVVYAASVASALADRSTGYELIASLFGLATDTREESGAFANRGRLKVETTPFDSTTQGRELDVSGVPMPAVGGPANAARHMAVRNPIDRVTHASREGGLHHFLEFRRGEKFGVTLSIANPRAVDLGLIALWRREIDDGLLRFGALHSIGRGRVRIVRPTYQLWRRPNAPEFAAMTQFQAREVDPLSDALAGIWRRYDVPAEALDGFIEHVHEYAGGEEHASPEPV